jgi:hypothetical protein
MVAQPNHYNKELMTLLLMLYYRYLTCSLKDVKRRYLRLACAGCCLTVFPIFYVLLPYIIYVMESGPCTFYPAHLK